LEIAKARMDPASAARKFGVSVELIEWRRRMTGVDAQLTRSQARWSERAV